MQNIFGLSDQVYGEDMPAQNYDAYNPRLLRFVILIQLAGELVRVIEQRQFVQLYSVNCSLEYEQSPLSLESGWLLY